MSRRAPIWLPPSSLDLAVARVCARLAFPKEEYTLRALTVLADEKTLVAGTALCWAYTRFRYGGPRGQRKADRILVSILVASALPHILKRLFARKRPDRVVVRRQARRGIPHSGNAWDSFPSGHAGDRGAVDPLDRSALPRSGLAGTRIASCEPSAAVGALSKRRCGRPWPGRRVDRLSGTLLASGRRGRL